MSFFLTIFPLSVAASLCHDFLRVLATKWPGEPRESLSIDLDRVKYGINRAGEGFGDIYNCIKYGDRDHNQHHLDLMRPFTSNQPNLLITKSNQMSPPGK